MHTTIWMSLFSCSFDCFFAGRYAAQHKEHFWFIHTSGMEEAILESEKEDTCRLHWSVDVQWDERGIVFFVLLVRLRYRNVRPAKRKWRPKKSWLALQMLGLKLIPLFFGMIRFSASRLAFFGRLKGLKRHMNLFFHGWTSAQAKKKLLIFELTCVA